MEDLVLVGSQLKDETWQSLQRLANVQWLDVSFSNITDENLTWLGQSEQLERLSLEGTQASAKTLENIRSIPSLRELDLSRCPNIDDGAVSLLANNDAIQVLWLTKTPITKSCLETLATMPNLRSVDVTGSQISDDDWRSFVSLHPRFAP